MTITPLGDVVLTQEEQDAILGTLVVPWSLVFEVVEPGSSQSLSYIGGFGSNPEDLANWAWLGNPNDRPDDADLLAAFSTFATQYQADALENERIAKWQGIVQDEVSADIQNIPGWFSWTEDEALTWITNNIAPELSASAPKTLQGITALTRMLIAMRNQLWPHFEGS